MCRPRSSAEVIPRPRVVLAAPTRPKRKISPTSSPIVRFLGLGCHDLVYEIERPALHLHVGAPEIRAHDRDAEELAYAEEDHDERQAAPAACHLAKEIADQDVDDDSKAYGDTDEGQDDRQIERRGGKAR